MKTVFVWFVAIEKKISMANSFVDKIFNRLADAVFIRLHIYKSIYIRAAAHEYFCRQLICSRFYQLID